MTSEFWFILPVLLMICISPSHPNTSLPRPFILFVYFLPAGDILQKHFVFTLPLTLLLIRISTTHAPSFDSRFSKVDPGDGVTGQVEESYSFITLDECIVRYVKTVHPQGKISYLSSYKKASKKFRPWPPIPISPPVRD